MRWLISPYDLPLRQPWPGIGERRRGWIVAISHNGLTGLGDCAPLPALGSEDFATAEQTLRQSLPLAVLGAPPAEIALAFDPAEHLQRWRGCCRDAPAAACAIDTALCDLAARTAGLPLARWLNGAAARRVRVWSDKLKLPADLGQALRLIAATPGAVRLDANQAYGFDDAVTLITALRHREVDHLEEPLRAPSLAELAVLQQMADFPIALDESLAGFGVEAVLRSRLRRVVLKPVLHGGPLRTLELARRLRSGGIEVVVTTAMDSAIGAWMAAHVAAALDNGLAHGLDTARWLAEDVAAGPAPRDGWLEIPDRVGGDTLR